MTKADLVTKMRDDYGITKKEAEVMVDYTFDALHKLLLTGEEVYIYGFGKFVINTRAAKIGRNPRTGEAVPIPERKVLKFIPTKNFAEDIAN